MLALLGSFAAPASGQWAQGDSLRLKLPGALKIQGTMSRMHGDTMMVSVPGLMDLWPVPVGALESLEMFVARSPREGFRHGAGMGLVGGVFAGALVGIGLHAVGARDPNANQGQQLVQGTITWAAAGAFLGMLTGGLLGGSNPGEGWVAVPLPHR